MVILMCGRYAIDLDEAFFKRYEGKRKIEIKPNFNVSPYSYIPAIINTPPEIVKMRWGFVPSWSKELNSKFATINSRAETIDNKPYFKSAFRKTRCIIPATGFYEWKKTETEKIPFYIHLKDNSYMPFAGIYSIWKDVEGYETYTCSIITTTANELVEDIHDRMPVILNPKDQEVWLDQGSVDDAKLKSLLSPYPANAMEAYPVSAEVNSAKNNGKGLIDPVGNKLS